MSNRYFCVRVFTESYRLNNIKNDKKFTHNVPHPDATATSLALITIFFGGKGTYSTVADFLNGFFT